jgi:hypothetical protein
MRASRRGPSSNTVMPSLPATLPKIGLRHGEALWVLSSLGFQGNASKSTFYEYIKSLRKLGTPFERGKIGYGRRGLANYSYDHLMELALALTMRVYHTVPDTVLTEMVRYRKTLNRCYRRAYIERLSGFDAPIELEANGRKLLTVRGLFLDLQIDFSGGTLTAFGPPKLLSAQDALFVFVEREVAGRALLPINISLLSERLVATVLQVQAARSRTKDIRANRRPRPSAWRMQ